MPSSETILAAHRSRSISRASDGGDERSPEVAVCSIRATSSRPRPAPLLHPTGREQEIGGRLRGGHRRERWTSPSWSGW